MILPGPALRICPNCALARLPLGLLKFAWLRTFVPSPRNSKVWFSVTLNNRDTLASIVHLPGPYTVPGPMFPKVPSAGIPNAAGSSHRHEGLVLRKSLVHLLPYTSSRV